ncbi:MAG: hypothetical protein II244_05805, partial [Clostridia bacterium]|nr:hypothetical protein [Clostridia bacterium]
MARLEQIPKSEPTFNDLMIMAQNNIMARTNCHNVGRIIEFDKTTQTCTVQIMQLKQFFDKTMAAAPITDVPLIIYGMGDGFITLPDPVGSICLLFFMDRNIDAFLETGELYEPDNTRLHDFSDCIAITTFSTLNNPIENYDDTAITIAYKKLEEDVLYNAVIKNFGNSLQFKVSTEDNTTQINISDKVNIQNTSQNLASL